MTEKEYIKILKRIQLNIGILKENFRDRRIQGTQDGLRMAMDILSDEYNSNRKEEQK